jgi:hypothetical protein
VWVDGLGVSDGGKGEGVAEVGEQSFFMILVVGIEGGLRKGPAILVDAMPFTR